MRIRFGLSIIVILFTALSTVGCNRTVLNKGEAMSPTLKDDEMVSTTRLFADVKRGDIVAFRYPQDESKSFVKRVVGVPGDEISASDGFVSINGKPLDEPYVVDSNRSHDSWGPITVRAGEYFVMGDNRRNSSDSRHWGSVKRDAIWGKVDR
jgi:signal peptidase I